MLKRAVKIGIVSIAVLIATVLILIETARFQQWVLHHLESFADSAGITVGADRLRLNLRNLEATFEDFVFDDRSGTRITADRLSINVPWSQFRSEIILLNSLEADGLRVEIRPIQPSAPEPPSEPRELPQIRFGRIAIRDGTFLYADEDMSVSVPSFDLEAADGQGALELSSPVTISPDTVVDIREVPVAFFDDRLQFGPSRWGLEHPELTGSGWIEGDFRWTPAIDLDLGYSAEAFQIRNWMDVQSSGRVRVADGVFTLSDFQATVGVGELIGSATISEAQKSAAFSWMQVGLDPEGLPAVTEGTLQLQWLASDFSDLSGEGFLSIDSRDYGTARGNVTIQNSQAVWDLTANAFDAAIRASVRAGFDQSISGTFLATHRRYGVVNLQGTIGGTFTQPVINSRLTARDVSYEDIGPLNAEANVRLQGMNLSISDVEARLHDSSLSGGVVRINLETRRMAGEVPEVNLLLEDFVSDASGPVMLTATVEGTLDAPSASVIGSSPGLALGGTRIDSVEFAAGLAGNEVRITRLVARQMEGILEAGGIYNFSTGGIMGEVSVSNLQLTDVQDLSAAVFLEAEIRGTTDSPAADFRAQLIDVVYQDLQHGTLDIEGTAGLQMASVRIQSDKYTASASAEVELEQPYAFRASILTNGTRVDYEQYDVTANGTVHTAGQIQPFQLVDLSFEDFTLETEGVDAAASGSLADGVRVSATADLSELPVDDVRALRMEGLARLEAIVRGSIDAPLIDGEFVATDATVQAEGMNEPAVVQAAIDFTNDQFRVRQLRADYAGATAEAAGQGSLRGSGEFQFQIENIRPERFLTDRPVTGLVRVEGNVAFDRPEVEAMRGEARFTQLELTLADVPVRQLRPAEIALENQIVSIRDFEIEGLDTRATITGNMDIATGALHFDIVGDTDIRIVEAFLPGSNALGQLRSEIAIRGDIEQPVLDGFIDVVQMQLQFVDPPILLSETDAQIRLAGERLQITDATGILNGGPFTAFGSTGISSGGLHEATLRLDFDRTLVEYPEGLESEVSSQLALTGSSPDLLLAGNVDILNALYRQDIDLTQEVFSRVAARTAMPALPEITEPGLIEQIRLDISVGTPGLVTVTNNMANLDLTGSFLVRGTVGEPIILGRAVVLEGGELYFGPQAGRGIVERRDRYVIEQGSIDFNNPVRTEPEFSFLATHELSVPSERYLITLRVDGTPANLRTELTSDPPKAEYEIVLMLLTGRTSEDLQEAHLAFAGEQLANYLSGELSGFVGAAGAALGLDTVRIAPETLDTGEDISARLTIGKNITRDFSLIYSQTLSNARAQTWIANYQTVHNLLLRAVNEAENNTVRLELRHDLRFGGGPPLPGRVAPRLEAAVGEVIFEGATLPEADLLRRVTRPGRPFNAYRLSEDLRSLQQFYASHDYLTARIRAVRTPRDGLMDLRFIIQEGPRITLAYEGATVPSRVRDEIREIWIDGLAEALSVRNSRNRLLRHFRDERYVQADVEVRDESPDETERHFVFAIEQGPRFRRLGWVFRGIAPMDMAETAGTVLENPTGVKERIEFELQSAGYVAASATAPELITEDQNAWFEVNVDRGPLYSPGAITFGGNSFFDDADLGTVTAASRGEIFTPAWLDNTRQRLISHYWQNGFNNAHAVPSTTVDRASARVDVHFDITEGERQVFDEIRIEGREITASQYVLRQFTFMEGDPVDFSQVNLTRKRLYDTRLFKRVDLDVVDTPFGSVAHLRLNEQAPWRLRYGITVSNDLQRSSRTLGVVTDLSYGNILGRGIASGISVRANPSERDGRFFVSLPTLLGKDVTTTGTVFRSRTQDVQCDPLNPDLVCDLAGFTLQQQWRLQDLYILSYDYSYRRNRTFDRNLDPQDPFGFDITFPVARFNATLSRDTRDDILNATRGTFLSNSFELAPPGVGSFITFLKNYVQYFRFRPVRENLLWASGVRLGLGKGFSGQELIPTERFTAGGSTSVRGFKQDQLTSHLIADDRLPLPGEAVFILNQELRFPLFWRLGGVGFLDVGNVYPTLGEFNPLKLRYSPGIGLRVETPFVLLRFDLGINVFPRPGEPRTRFGFGIGQAF